MACPSSSPGAYLGVVPREHLLCDGGNIVQHQLVPLFLVAHLVHVDVDGGHVLIATLDPRVLEDGPTMDSDAALYQDLFFVALVTGWVADEFRSD